MDDIEASTYWCHMCSQTVNPIIEVETIKCPICQSGFVEEMSSGGNDTSPLDFRLGGSDSDRALSLWAPILLGMMGNRRHRRRFRDVDFGEDENDYDSENHPRAFYDEESDLDRELESIMRRRRNSASAILELLQGVRAGMSSLDSGDSVTDEHTRDDNTGTRNSNNNERDGERVILINPFNQTIVVQGPYDPSTGTQSRAPIGSLGDYFMGPGLDLLLQHLAENDPNRYGTPPAKKEAVEALATVKIGEMEQCAVCLDDFEIGTEVKEMPCKHKFHCNCLLPWLELHSSCPVCRYQLPCDEAKVQDAINSNEGNENNTNNVDNGNNDNGRQFSLPLLWPFGSLFSSSSGSRPNSGNATTSSTNTPSSSSQAEENN